MSSRRDRANFIPAMQASCGRGSPCDATAPDLSLIDGANRHRSPQSKLAGRFDGRRSRLDRKLPSDQEIHRRAASHGRITGPASLVDHVPIAE